MCDSCSSLSLLAVAATAAAAAAATSMGSLREAPIKDDGLALLLARVGRALEGRL